MKKLIALAIVAVMLVAMAANVLANETVYAAPVMIDGTSIGDGTISDGEYGRPIAHINSNTAYDVDHDDDVIEGYQGYAYYQGADPFEQDVILYVAVSGDTTGANAAQAGARLYFAFDELIPDGKFFGGFNGMAGEDHWCNTAAQFRVSFHDEPTDDVTGDLWASGKSSNIIASIYTKDFGDGYVTDGFSIASWDGLKDGAQLSVCDHTYDRTTLLVDSAACAGSAGVHGSRAHFEFIIRSSYFYNADKTFVAVNGENDYYLKAGDYFACSFTFFIALNNDNWNGLISWGSGIDWPTNQSTMGATGSNKIVIPTWEEYWGSEDEPEDPTDDPTDDPADTGDALVVVVATAIMALGTALIVKKVK